MNLEDYLKQQAALTSPTPTRDYREAILVDPDPEALEMWEEHDGIRPHRNQGVWDMLAYGRERFTRYSPCDAVPDTT